MSAHRWRGFAGALRWRGFAIRASQYRRHGLQIRASNGDKKCFFYSRQQWGKISFFNGMIFSVMCDFVISACRE